MAKNDLLKEAIADAKAVRETALANAKIALEEAFTPRIQSMLSAKLAEEEEMEEAAEEPTETNGKGMDAAAGADVNEEEDMEEGMHGDEEKKMDEEKDDMDEDISLDEIISALREEEEDKVEEAKEDELEEAYNVIRFLKSKINEVNLLNAKLLFSNKLFRNHSMNESQKMKVIENFDRASNLREVKLVFATLSESFNLNTSKTKRTIKESYASKSSASTAPSKKVISEGNDLAARWKKLANL